jgi:hypothetical protein
MRWSELQSGLPSVERDASASVIPSNKIGLDLSRSLTMLRSSGAYARGMYACEGAHDLQAVSSRATPSDHRAHQPSPVERRVVAAWL